MLNFKAPQVSFYRLTNFAFYFILRPEVDFVPNYDFIFMTEVFFDDMIHFLHKENIMTFTTLNCCIPCSLKLLLQRSKISTEKGKAIPSLVKTPFASQATVNFFDGGRASNVFFVLYKLWDTTQHHFIEPHT